MGLLRPLGPDDAFVELRTLRSDQTVVDILSQAYIVNMHDSVINRSTMEAYWHFATQIQAAEILYTKTFEGFDRMLHVIEEQIQQLVCR